MTSTFISPLVSSMTLDTVAPFPDSFHREPHLVEIWLFTRTTFGVVSPILF